MSSKLLKIESAQVVEAEDIAQLLIELAAWAKTLPLVQAAQSRAATSFFGATDDRSK